MSRSVADRYAWPLQSPPSLCLSPLGEKDKMRGDFAAMERFSVTARSENR